MHSCFVAFAFFLLFFTSCQKSVDDNTTYLAGFNTNWIPLYKGYWVEYKVDSFYYITNTFDTFTSTKSNSTYYREVVEDSIIGFYPQPVVKIAVYKRLDSLSTWQFDHYYTSYSTNTQILENNYNNQTISVQGPISASTKWQGYQYIDSSITNPYSRSYFYYQSILPSYTLNSFQFDSTIQIVRYQDSNAIEYRSSQTWYALGVGLIYSTQFNLEKQDAIKPWSQAENGWKINRTITRWKR